MTEEKDKLPESTRQIIRGGSLGIAICTVIAIATFGENAALMRVLVIVLAMASFTLIFLLVRSSASTSALAPVLVMSLAVGIGSVTFLMGEVLGQFWRNILYGLVLLLMAMSYLVRFFRANSVAKRAGGPDKTPD